MQPGNFIKVSGKTCKEYAIAHIHFEEICGGQKCGKW